MGKRVFQSVFESLNSFLHYLSYLSVFFALAAGYYQVRALLAFRGSNPDHQQASLHHFILSLTMWGFFMALLSLSDSERMTAKEIEGIRRKRVRMRRNIVVIIVSSLITIVMGFFLLLSRQDQLQGVAITCFGTGLLGMARLLLGRLKYVETLPGERNAKGTALGHEGGASVEESKRK